MEIILFIIVVVILALVVRQVKQKTPTAKYSFKQIVQKTFPKYKIIEKNQQIMICEINHRNEPDELVFIRIGNPKNIRKSGRMVIADYPKAPSPQEMKSDFGRYL